MMMMMMMMMMMIMMIMMMIETKGDTLVAIIIIILTSSSAARCHQAPEGGRVIHVEYCVGPRCDVKAGSEEFVDCGIFIWVCLKIG